MFVRRKKNRSGTTSVVVVDKHGGKFKDKGLWVVERALRISKGTIETRPIFHFTERRIEAHVCLCFVAYKIYKELERIVYSLGLDMSVDTVLKIAKTITTIRLRLPLNGSMLTRTMLLTQSTSR